MATACSPNTCSSPPRADAAISITTTPADWSPTTPRPAMRPIRGSAGSAASLAPPARLSGSAAHPFGDAAKVLGDDVPVAFGLEIVLLMRTIFGRPRHEGGLQAMALRGLQIVVVGR